MAHVRQAEPGCRTPTGLDSLPLNELARLCGEGNLSAHDWSQVAFLDLETTGLGGTGTVAFLAGIGFTAAGCWEVRQYFLPAIDDEPALLWELARVLGDRPVLVTFNGKSFDWQILLSRWIQNRIVPPTPVAHLDVLHPVRRLYGGALPSCSLISLEQHLLGFDRLDDIPGGEIPAMYFSYLARGDHDILQAVLEHNVMDIESTALVAARLMRLACGGMSPGPVDDLLAWARLWVSRDCPGRAEQCLKALADEYGPSTRQGYRACVEMGLLLKSSGRFCEAARWFERACTDDDPFRGIDPRIELAKHFEHRLKDLKRALELTDQCLQILRRRRSVAGTGARSQQIEASLLHRRARLRRRLSKS